MEHDNLGLSNNKVSYALRVRGLKVTIGDLVVLDNLNLDLAHGEILGVAGTSGSGKSVLLRTIVGLIKKRSGIIHTKRSNTTSPTTMSHNNIGHKWGVVFQHGALFSSLTVLENIKTPMVEHIDASDNLITELAYIKLELVGLERNVATKYPNELSGGMVKRVALARALALDPEILFLDEPTAGLDPIARQQLDNLIINLRDIFAFTVFMITHELNSLGSICDKIAILKEKNIVVHGNKEVVYTCDDPWVQSFLRGGTEL